MTTRDFDSMLAAKAGVRPTFTVGGQEFSLRSKLPSKTWNRLLASMRSDDVTPEEANVAFFSTILAKKDRQRFLDLLANEGDEDDDDDTGVIDLSQVDAITDWAMEHFTGKRLSNNDSSTPSANGVGVAPNVVSLQSRATNA